MEALIWLLLIGIGFNAFAAGMEALRPARRFQRWLKQKETKR